MTVLCRTKLLIIAHSGAAYGSERGRVARQDNRELVLVRPVPCASCGNLRCNDGCGVRSAFPSIDKYSKKMAGGNQNANLLKWYANIII